MTHRIDVRLPDKIYKELKKQPHTMTHNVCTALTQYLYKDTQPMDKQYNVEILDLLKDQIQDLRNDKTILQQRLDYFMTPWYMRLALQKPKIKQKE